jgi:hypothetical protein
LASVAHDRMAAALGTLYVHNRHSPSSFRRLIPVLFLPLSTILVHYQKGLDTKLEHYPKVCCGHTSLWHR